MMNRLKNAVWVLLGVAAVFWAMTSLVGVVQGGDLDPPAAPGSTMQALDEIPPSWHRFIPSTDRFEDFGQALGYILDHETGLVWEESPSSTEMDWFEAVEYCYTKSVAGEIGVRKGWRLPTIEEQQTLIDTTQAAPALPSGHPFLNLPGPEQRFWSMTTDTGDVTAAYATNLTSGAVAIGSIKTPANTYRAWCVRGGHGYDFHGQS